MNDSDQIDAFAKDLDALVDRYRAEFDLTYGAVIGTLQIKVHSLCVEADEAKDNE